MLISVELDLTLIFDEFREGLPMEPKLAQTDDYIVSGTDQSMTTLGLHEDGSTFK